MFTNSSGHQFYGSNFYNVGGAVNLIQNVPIRNHHLALRGLRGPAGAIGGRERSSLQRTAHNEEGFGIGSEPKGGAVRTAHGKRARPGPYGAMRLFVDVHREVGQMISSTATWRTLRALLLRARPDLLLLFIDSIALRLPHRLRSHIWIIRIPHRQTGRISLRQTSISLDPETITEKGREKEGSSSSQKSRDHETKIIQINDLKLTRELCNRAEYCFHAGQNKGRAVIVKLFNPGPSALVRKFQQLESTVDVLNGIMHSNILRLSGISSPESSSQFICPKYAPVSWKLEELFPVQQNAEGPLAAALETDLARRLRLDLKWNFCELQKPLRYWPFDIFIIAQAGMNHILFHGVSLGSMGADDFDIFLDVEDRFVIDINPRRPDSDEEDITEFQALEATWIVFNAVCEKRLMAANRVLHHEEINRDPAILSDVIHPSDAENVGTAPDPAAREAAQDISEEELPARPRREYVWRSMNRGQQTLATVANQLTVDLDMNLSRLNRSTRTNSQSTHRCPGYVREEITLATTARHGAVVAHDAPSPLEICSICHEEVGHNEVFRCICGDPAPGARHTIKCRECKLWSHSDCVGKPKKEFTCQLCVCPEDPRFRSYGWGSDLPYTVDAKESRAKPVQSLLFQAEASSTVRRLHQEAKTAMDEIQRAQDEPFYATFPEARRVPARAIVAEHERCCAPTDLSLGSHAAGTLDPCAPFVDSYSFGAGMYPDLAGHWAYAGPDTSPPRLMMRLPSQDLNYDYGTPPPASSSTAYSDLSSAYPMLAIEYPPLTDTPVVHDSLQFPLPPHLVQNPSYAPPPQPLCSPHPPRLHRTLRPLPYRRTSSPCPPGLPTQPGQPSLSLTPPPDAPAQDVLGRE
ncbi:hypothetical protein K438DRAFT_2074767 [Mycena galopus ATCC 62051]|nr:hypothetical protein K438DRAFT_2074767 [Mycena galopus ATCC 62051]